MTFPGFLQNHSPSPAELRLTDREDFDRYLRHSALFARGLVVVDSDLNNNAAFHLMSAEQDSLFWEAIKSGFIRRAVREDDRGNRPSQREIAESFRMSNPEIFNSTEIPSGYPERLDEALALAESEQEPVIWTRQYVSNVAHDRMLALLKSLRIKGGNLALLRLIDSVEIWIREQAAAGVSFGAADLDRKFSSGEAEQQEAWATLWPKLLNANQNNIPYVFEGRLPVCEASNAPSRMLPAGPKAGPAESAAEGLIYAGEAGRVSLNVHYMESPVDNFTVDENVLAQLNLEQIETLREEASPATLLDTRFDALGSSEMLTGLRGTLDQHFADYYERLAGAGMLLTRKVVHERLAAPIYIPSSIGPQAIQISATVLDSYIEFCLLEQHHLYGQQEVCCDFTTLLEKLDPEHAEALRRSNRKFSLRFKRPDYRAIKRLAGTS